MEIVHQQRSTIAIITKQPRKQVIDLTGTQGNAFYLLGLASMLCKQIGMSEHETNFILEEMKSSGYTNLIETFDRHFGMIIDLERQMTKQELVDRLERIRDGVLDADTRHMVEGMCADITDLMFDIENVGIDEQILQKT